MLRSVQGRAACLIALVGIFIAGISAEASAKSRNRLPPVEQVAPAVPSGARFFTINQVLAKLDSGSPAKTNAGVRLAVASDAKVEGAAPGVADVARDEPFGLVSFRAPQGTLWVKWRGVNAAAADEAGITAWCREGIEPCAAPALRYISLVDSTRKLPIAVRIAAVNRVVNETIQYVSDYAQHRTADRWSPPLATLASGRGDCEDYALLKYSLLIESGIAPANLRLLLVRDLQVRQDHAVLAVKAEGRWLVLDNRTARPLDIAEVRHFMPLFAIDHDGVKLLAAPYAARPLHESEIDVAPATAEMP